MARENIYQEEEFPSPLMQLWYNFKKNPMVMLAFGSYLALAIFYFHLLGMMMVMLVFY
jgi:cationic peptide transport system permease protein